MAKPETGKTIRGPGPALDARAGPTGALATAAPSHGLPVPRVPSHTPLGFVTCA